MSLDINYVICVTCISKKLKYQKRSKGIKNWKVTNSVILGVLSNMPNLMLEHSSPLSNLVQLFILFYCSSDNSAFEITRPSLFQFLTFEINLTIEYRHLVSLGRKCVMYTIVYYYGYNR